MRLPIRGAVLRSSTWCPDMWQWLKKKLGSESSMPPPGEVAAPAERRPSDGDPPLDDARVLTDAIDTALRAEDPERAALSILARLRENPLQGVVLTEIARRAAVFAPPERIR